VADLVKTESWIMDGTYESTLDLRLPAADVVIFVKDWSILRFHRILFRRLGGSTRPARMLLLDKNSIWITCDIFFVSPKSPDQ